MPIRKIGESLWEICKEKARENYGLLYEEEYAGKICEEYAKREKSSGLLTIKSIDRKGLVSFLKKAANKESADKESADKESADKESADKESADNHMFIPEKIEVVRENIYFIPSVFENKNVMDDKLIPKIEDLFNNNLVVSTQKIFQDIKIPYMEQQFFIKKLIYRDLIENLPEHNIESDAYIIGSGISNKLSKDQSIGQFKGVLSKFTSNGIVTKADLARLTGISVTEEIIDYFTQKNILCRLCQKTSQYFICSMQKEFVEYFMKETKEQLQRYIREHEYAITHGELKTFFLDKLEKLYGMEKTELSDSIMNEIMESIPSPLKMETAGEYNEILYDVENLDQIADKETKKIDNNLPPEVMNSLKSAGNGREKLSNYIKEIIESKQFNENSAVDNFMKKRIIEHSKEIILEGYFPTVKNGE